MSALLIYMVKVAVYITVFYLIYSILLSKDASYSRNRAFILISIAASLALPALTLPVSNPAGFRFFGKELPEVFVSANSKRINGPVPGDLLSSPLFMISTIYTIVVICLLLKLIFSILNLRILIARHKRQKKQRNHIIRFNGFRASGFSAMGYIFINARLNHEEAMYIARHEKNHIRKNHFLDILFIEMVTAFQWFNPFIYFLNRSLRAIHEYQADRGCLNSGISLINYQCLLLSQVFKTNSFNLTNSFSNPSLIKKRMQMMGKRPASPISNLKLLTVIPVIGLVFIVISAYKAIPDNQNVISVDAFQASPVETKSEFISEVAPSPPPPSPAQTGMTNNPALTGMTIRPALTGMTTKETVVNVEVIEEQDVADKSSEPEPFVVVEEMPKFPGGDANLLKHIAEHVNYPQTAKENHIQGRVIVRFCVNATGSVDRISILRGVSPDLDAEAIRVVGTLPPFQPGRQSGKTVPVWYMAPITFTLK